MASQTHQDRCIAKTFRETNICKHSKLLEISFNTMIVIKRSQPMVSEHASSQTMEEQVTALLSMETYSNQNAKASKEL